MFFNILMTTTGGDEFTEGIDGDWIGGRIGKTIGIGKQAGQKGSGHAMIDVNLSSIKKTIDNFSG